MLPQNIESIINYLQKSTEVAEWGTPSCSRPQLAMDNGVRDGRSNRLVAPPPSWVVTPERLVHKCSVSGNGPCNRSMRGNHFANAATQGICKWNRKWFRASVPCDPKLWPNRIHYKSYSSPGGIGWIIRITVGVGLGWLGNSTDSGSVLFNSCESVGDNIRA